MFLAQPKIKLPSFKSTPDSLKQRLKAFERNSRWVPLFHRTFLLERWLVIQESSYKEEQR